MNEICTQFGTERHLCGTLTLPGATPPAPVGVLLFNAGVIHRIGPHRINVKLARHLASLGIASLRFDLSGQGDSRASSSPAPYREQAVADLRAAMDQFERMTGVQRFAVFGICSGADHGWACAQQDERLVGLFMLDGYAYPTRKTRWLLYQRKFEERGWRSSLGWAVQRAADLPARLLGRSDAPDTSDGRETPPAADFARATQALVDRGVDIVMLYSGSLLNTYNYPEQFQDVFGHHPFAQRIRCEFRPDIDHTVTPLAAQHETLRLVGDWARALASRVQALPQRNAA
jgi:pimeloyl-ACP methyl ester carboxylesterase